jgi:acyl dehydratase
MVTRGVYTEAEQKMIDDTNATQDRLAGWGIPEIATEHSMKAWPTVGDYMDYRNPLWRDDAYARKTRWGGLIAYPLYSQKMMGAMHVVLEENADSGHDDRTGSIWIGENWEFHQPIRANDEIRVWRRANYVEDITSLDGNGPRLFRFIPHDIDQINQRDELVCRAKSFFQFMFTKNDPVPLPYIPDYVYKPEELEAIDRMAEGEDIRGAEIRYWEDVNIGDEPSPIVVGPTCDFDNTEPGRGGGSFRFGSVMRKEPWEIITDPVTGQHYMSNALNYSERAAAAVGLPHCTLVAYVPRQLMVRLVTNWIGDDGFMTRFNWRNVSRVYVGDTLFASGKVVNKRHEKGKYLIDLKVMSENIQGNVVTAANVTVELISRENLYKWK